MASVSARLRLLTSHRGCVSPQNISTWRDETDGDMDNVDGYAELPDEMKEKVAKAIEQGHVDDEDWKWVRAALHLQSRIRLIPIRM